MLLPVLAEPESTLVFVFAVAFGAGMGIKTIVQATAAPGFLGRAGYGALRGAITIPAYAAQAVSPLAAAVVWQLGGCGVLEPVLLVYALAAAVAFVVAAMFALRPQDSGDD